MHSQSTLVIYFFGVIQRKQQVLLAFFCKLRFHLTCCRFETNFVTKVGVWLGILFIFSKPLYISILQDLTVICKWVQSLFFFFFFISVSSYLLTSFIVCFKVCRRRVSCEIKTTMVRNSSSRNTSYFDNNSTGFPSPNDTGEGENLV